MLKKEYSAIQKDYFNCLNQLVRFNTSIASKREKYDPPDLPSIPPEEDQYVICIKKIKEIIESDEAAVEWKDGEGKTALSYAIEAGDLNFIKYLVEDKKQSVNKYEGGMSLYGRAMWFGREKVAQYLKEELGANWDQEEQSRYHSFFQPSPPPPDAPGKGGPTH